LKGAPAPTPKMTRPPLSTSDGRHRLNQNAGVAETTQVTIVPVGSARLSCPGTPGPHRPRGAVPRAAGSDRDLEEVVRGPWSTGCRSRPRRRPDPNAREQRPHARRLGPHWKAAHRDPKFHGDQFSVVDSRTSRARRTVGLPVPPRKRPSGTGTVGVQVVDGIGLLYQGVASPAATGLPAGAPRRARGLRQKELAMLVGISVDYLVRLEQGRATNPRRRCLARGP